MHADEKSVGVQTEKDMSHACRIRRSRPHYTDTEPQYINLDQLPIRHITVEGA